MNFREWLKIDEQQHVSFTKPIKINGIDADSIDFRFEDWQLGQKDGGMAVFPNGGNFFDGDFSAPLKNKMWLNINKSGKNSGGISSTEGGAARQLVVLSQDAYISEEPTERPLPPYWERFAVFYYKNGISKPAEHVRKDQYEVELHQKYLDTRSKATVHQLPQKDQAQKPDPRIADSKPQVEPSNF